MAVGLGVLHRADHEGGAAVGGRTNVEQPERIRDDRRVHHILDVVLLGEARQLVVDGVTRVLDLHPGEILLSGAEQIHAATGIEAEVHRVGGADELEAQPVGVVRTVALIGLQEALRCGVGADDQRNVGGAGQDLAASDLQGGDARGARCVARRHLRPVETKRSRERGTGDIAGVPVSHRDRAGDVADVVPVDTGFVERLASSNRAVLDEVAAPLPPGVHPDADDRDFVHDQFPSPAASVMAAPRGRHFHTVYSCSSSSLSTSM